MGTKPTYEELKQKVAELEAAQAMWDRTAQELEARNKELQNHSRLLDTMTGQMADMVYYKDNEFRYLYSSKPHCDRILKCTQEECIGLTDVEIAERYRQSGHEQGFGEICINSDEETKKAGKPSQFDEVAAVDGEEIWLEVYKTPLYDEEGDFSGIVGCSREVTKRKKVEEELRKYRDSLEELVQQRTDELEGEIAERKRAEQALMQSEQLYRSTIDAIGDEIFVIDPSFRITLANDALLTHWRRQYGSEAELIGKKASEALSFFSDEVRDESKQVFASGEALVTEQTIVFEGRKIVAEVRKIPVLEGDKVPLVVTIVRDITAKRQVEEALRDSEERYRAFVNQSADGMFLVEPETKRIADLNPALPRLLGYSLEELLQMSLDDLIAHDLAEIEKNLQTVLNTGHFREERKYRRKDGTLMDVEVTASLISYGGKKVVSVVLRDASERKRFERDLEKERDRAQNYFDIAGVMILVIGLDGKVKRINQKGCQILECDENEIVGKAWIENFVPKRITAELETVLDALISGNAEEHEYYENPVLTKNGEERTVAWHNSLVRDSAGTIIEYVGSGTDITEQKRAEAALLESERQYRELFEQSRDAIFLTTRDGRVLDVNQEALNLFGYTKAEMLALDIAKDLYARPGARSAYQQELEEKGFVRDYPLPLRKKDGTVLDIENTTTLMKDDKGTVVGYLGISRDVTERNRVERALRESFEKREELENIVNRSPGVAFLWRNAEGWPVEFVSENVREYGYRPEDFYSGKVVFSDIVHPEDLQRVAAEVSQYSMEEKRVGFTQEYRVVTPFGDARWIDDRTWIRRNEDGAITHFQGVVFDITERKHAEEALKESEQRLELALMGADLGLWDWNIETGEVVYNARWAEIREYDLDDIEPSIKSFEKTVHPDDYPGMMKALEQHVQGNTPHYESEYRSKTKSGEWRWVLDRGKVVQRDTKGAPIRAAGTNRDITEQKEAEEALRESETRFRTLVEQAPLGIQIFNTEGLLIQANHSWEDIWGAKAEEAIGKHNALEDEQIKKMPIYPLIQRVFAGETVNFPDIEFDPAVSGLPGDKRWVRTRAYQISNERGDPLHNVLFSEDVTERRQAEEAVRESEKRYRDLVDNANSVILHWNAEGEIVFMNPFGLDFFGYREEELIGRNILGSITPETEDGTKRDLATMINDIQRDPDKYKHNENENIRKDGSSVWLSWTNKAIRNEEGTVVEILSVGHDITERKRAEEEKKRLEGQLFQAQKMKAIGTLAGGIAHDFNNLLMGIQGRVSLMSLGREDEDPHTEHLQGIEEMVRRGADLTGQLLGFARGGKYEVKPTDLNDLVLQSSQMFGRAKKEIKISGVYQKDVWTVEVDQGQIEQVLLSLYVNSAQAMPAGGELSLQTENVVLEESFAEVFQTKPGKHVKVSVTDTGMGMDQETKERIFDPFFTTRDMGRGAGLSLASAYGVIKSHGGAIDVHSEEGKGTTISIYLPASEKAVVREKKPIKESVQGEETVLLVDDEDMILEIGDRLLRSMGYTVLQARGGKEAVKIYEEKKDGIDIVLLDLVMPDMGGAQTYDRLKEIDPDIKVLLASGYSVEGQAEEVLKRGCNGFIQKPFNLKQLSEKLREILDEEG